MIQSFERFFDNVELWSELLGQVIINSFLQESIQELELSDLAQTMKSFKSPEQLDY